MNRILSTITIFVLLALACASTAPTEPQGPFPTAEVSLFPTQFIETQPALSSGEPIALTVMTHDSFAISESILAAFEQANNIKVTFLASGDAGAMLNKAILTKDTPLADVLFGVDNAFLSRALDAGIFEEYESPLRENIPAEFYLDPTNRAIPVDFSDVCVNYDRAFFGKNELAVPQSLEELTAPEYRDMLVMENPATSSTGLAFLLATVVHFGEGAYLEYWSSLRANGLVVVNDWETAYYTNFSGSSGRGPQTMVVSYGTSPAAEVVYDDTVLIESPTASILGPDTCFTQIEFVGILAGTQKRAAAERFVDFVLSLPFQEDVPLQMFVYPIDPLAFLPDSFHQFIVQPTQPATMDPLLISINRDRWIAEWTQAVLR